MSDFYELNHIERPVPNAASPSELLDGRSRDKLLRYAFSMMKRERRWKGAQLWVWVAEITGHGSGYSCQICRELGWDTDMLITPKSELPRISADRLSKPVEPKK